MLFDKELKTFLPTTKPGEAKIFYKEKLGLMILSENESMLEFRANGIVLTILIVRELRPQPFPVLGWRVKNILEVISLLKSKGIFSEKYESLQQDIQGIWTSPAGSKFAWFKDPDGNILSISE
jgi:catechol-2,3-dioxygenase